MLPKWAGPLAVAQARKPQLIAEMAHEGNDVPKSARPPSIVLPSTPTKLSKEKRVSSAPEKEQVSAIRDISAITPPPAASMAPKPKPLPTDTRRPTELELKSIEARLSSSSLPLPSTKLPATKSASDVSSDSNSNRNRSDSIYRRHSHHAKGTKAVADMTPTQKTRLLRQHYFRSQTQFLTALEGISNRLVIVPKQARMSALRAELALISRDLPAEVDIPVICPPTLTDGVPSKSRHHRIVRLNPAESTVLNSAEKVPYLMMVEVLRDDFTFDPTSPDNQRLLGTLTGGSSGSNRRLFELSSADTPRTATATPTQEPAVDSVFEPTSGDLGSSPLIKSFDEEPQSRPTSKQLQQYASQRQSSGATTSSTTLDGVTPRTSEASQSIPNSPRTNNALQPQRNATADPDFQALATHMRTASSMLAQLDATSGKRPRQEVAAIRAKIIASMQSLEEQSFDMEEPTFDTIMAKASTAASPGPNNPDLEEGAAIDPNINASAGRERMENDFKTGGVQRRGDRDDPSAAVFGEAWEAKKERVRKSSPYGWMKNWDLVSVIVKTGADLRQEAFACQLISVCHKIWVDAGINVWVKLMRILVTGESSGLIETITNGVSLHSLKRSLTLASIESGQNPRGRIATLKDHFAKAFGAADSPPYRAGVDAFKRSLAAYSMISYVLQLKDRHNGNVLIDSEGHIIHIDFGFMLSNSPGSVGFEAAPFKLTHEYVDVLGGVGSQDYEDYKKLCKQAFQGTFFHYTLIYSTLLTHNSLALRRSADNIIDLVAMMGRESKMPCYNSGVAQATSALRQRFQLHLSADEAEAFVENDLIAKSFGSYYTRLYVTLLFSFFLF